MPDTLHDPGGLWPGAMGDRARPVAVSAPPTPAIAEGDRRAIDLHVRGAIAAGAADPSDDD